MSNRSLKLLRKIEENGGNCTEILEPIYSYKRCKKCPIERECHKRAIFLQGDNTCIDLSVEDRHKEILALVREKLAKIFLDKELRR